MSVQCAKIGSDDVVGTILHDNNVCFPMAKYISLIDTCGQHSHIFLRAMAVFDFKYGNNLVWSQL